MNLLFRGSPIVGDTLLLRGEGAAGPLNEPSAIQKERVNDPLIHMALRFGCHPASERCLL